MLESVNPYASVYSGLAASDQSGPKNTTLSPFTNNQTEQAQQAQDVRNRHLRAEPGQKKTGSDGQPSDTIELSREAEEIRQLQARDREVRAHEAAHAAVGGAYAGAPSYDFKRGPDGQTYAVGGEVNIDVSPIAGDPEATLQKAQQVRAAALAPAEPSGQDLRVAQKAQAMAAKARTELVEQRSEVSRHGGRAGEDSAEPGSVQSITENIQQTPRQPDVPSGHARLDIHA